MTTVIWLFIINLLAIILSHVLLYFRNYVQEKGKNLATKEDIEEITQKVETVKSEIGLLMQKKISYQAERYTALIDCHAQYHTWVNLIINTSITGDFNKADKFRQQAEQKLDAAFLTFLVAEAKFDIYFIGTPLIELENTLKIKTIEFANQLKIWLIKGHVISKQLALSYALADGDYKSAQLAELNARHLELITDFYKERNNLYHPLANLAGAFTKLVHEEVATM